MANYVIPLTPARVEADMVRRGSARSRAWERWSGPVPFPTAEARSQRSPRWVGRYRMTTGLLDLGVGVVSVGITYLTRFGLQSTPDMWAFLAVPFVWVFALSASGAYNAQTLGVGPEEYRSVARAGLAMFGAVAVASYLLNASFARGFVIPVSVLLLVGSLTAHSIMRSQLNRRRRTGQCLRSTLVIGPADAVAEVVKEMRSTPASGYEVVGVCVIGKADPEADKVLQGIPVVGRPEGVVGAVDGLGVEVVAVSSHPDLSGPVLRRLGWALAERKVDLVVSPGIMEVAGPRLSLRPAAGISLLHVERPADDVARLFAKRFVDVVLTSFLLLCVWPLGLIVALAIKLESRGPVFFLQQRVGAHGRSFMMVKFRSMVVDAEDRKADVSCGNEVNAVLFKHRRDPRITRVGRVIRRLSIDELPQLLNVLVGHMSLVGPRPPLPSEVARYEPDALQRLRVRPGMTGLWQVSGRSDLDWERSLRLDLWYVDNWTPVLDLQILVRTGRAVLGGAGAY